MPGSVLRILHGLVCLNLWSGTIIVSILPMRELKHRKVKKCMQVTQQERARARIETQSFWSWASRIKIFCHTEAQIIHYGSWYVPWEIFKLWLMAQRKGSRKVLWRSCGILMVMDEEVSRGRKLSKGRVQKKVLWHVWETAHRQSIVAVCGLFV